uniref:VWFA domain-containing protein n=1 Tax=Chrysemys picta bellii TaxID=8478 RepID=A0A8C3FSW3_CHRPI
LTGDCLTPAVLAPSHGFNVDVEGPITFQEAAEGFGQSMLQIGSARNVNKTGKVYKCDPGSRRCQEIPIQSRVTLCFESGLTSFLSLSECPKHVADIALLIDGSGSIAPVDFGKMKMFVSEIMKRFRKTDTQFALMQYSNKFKLHFNFMEYRGSRDPDHLLQGVEQLHGTTHTATAIRKVVRELFTSGKGARGEATKILMVITDGQKYNDPLSYSDVIPEAERAGVIRYAIGVSCGRAENYEGQQEFQEIASEPTRKHIFGVDNFNTLECIETHLQDKIIILEGGGTRYLLRSLPTLIFYDSVGQAAAGNPELGVVGAYEWSSGIYLYGSSGKLSFQNIPRTFGDMNDASLGYSSQVITANGQTTYMVGAPLCQGTGKVILFSRDTKGGEWTPRSELLGEQIGSYFGSTLCAVDLDRDGNTDLVLIGAPLYHTPLNGGRVYICPIKLPVRKRSATLHGQTGEVSGHFGASMSEIGDISGDGQTDVAIGAPMENDNRGALYIFHGEKGGLSPQYRQRIVGSQFPSKLHYFGQAVSSGTDLTGDGLPDIAVGAQGQVLLLRSRPVLRVSVSISFQPPTIPTSAFNCQEQEQLSTEASRAEVCFTVTKSTMDSLGDGIYSIIQYSLALDPGWTKIRVTFDSTSPVLSRELRLSIEKKCETYRIMLPLCPEDILTPITLRFNYTLTGEPITAAGGLRPILSEDSALVSAGLLPFQKDCGADGLTESSPTLVVGVTPELNITVSIQNHGENSYSTRVQFFYPAALSYRRVLLLQVPQCTPGMRGSLCRGRCAAESSQGFICFFQVKNLRQRSVPISVTFQFPVELSGVRVWDASEVVPSKVPASPCPSPARPLTHPVISFHPQDCSVATCKKIRCRIASLEMQQPLEFRIKGNVSFQWVSQVRELPLPLGIKQGIPSLHVNSPAPLPQVQTVVERSEAYNYLPIIMGSSVGGLVLLALITAALYKVSGAGLGPLPQDLSPWGQGLWLSQQFYKISLYDDTDLCSQPHSLAHAELGNQVWSRERNVPP